MRWTRQSIIEEIQRLHASKAPLNYSAATAAQPNLVRAAAWHFGTWSLAVEAAGIPYESLSKYQKWNQQRIIERIQELHQAGADLSWGAISTGVDPPLAAAAIRGGNFHSWREAIAAAGLDIDEVSRYQCWSAERIVCEIQELHRSHQPLSSKEVQSHFASLFSAARRRFGSWDNALVQAGLDPKAIRLRQPRNAKE